MCVWIISINWKWKSHSKRLIRERIMVDFIAMYIFSLIFNVFCIEILLYLQITILIPQYFCLRWINSVCENHIYLCMLYVGMYVSSSHCGFNWINRLQELFVMHWIKVLEFPDMEMIYLPFCFFFTWISCQKK